MCCFSGPVEQVQSTKIFARKSAADRQVLYAQGGRHEDQWETSARPAKELVDVGLSEGLVDPEAPVARRRIFGQRRNEDVWLPVTPP